MAVIGTISGFRSGGLAKGSFVSSKDPSFEPDRDIPRQILMLHALVVIGGFVLVGLAGYGIWQGFKLKPHDKLPGGKGSNWRT
jgi:hypothetical protein